MRLAARGRIEVAQKKILRLADILDRERDVIESRESVGRRLRLGMVEVGNLPELDQRAERRARGNECGRGAVRKSLLVDDADAVALHRIDNRLQMVDFDRQVM